jgi:hypothetical protein
MGKKKFFLLVSLLSAMALVWTSAPGRAGYKARPLSVRERDSYPAKLTSEGVTIAAEPLFSDALAARVFDKDDIVTRGIMPLAIIIFNDNDFPVEVEGSSIELIHESDHLHTLMPNEVVYRLFRKDKSSWLPQIPKLSKSDLNSDALEDFDHKLLVNKLVASHGKEAGFLYFQLREPKGLISYLANSTIYIPNVYRRDNGSRLVFFEIDLNAAVSAGSGSSGSAHE